MHEVALDLASIDFIFAHYLEDSFEVLEMFFFCLTVDSDVVDVDYCKFANDRSEYHVHESLEGGWGTFESKRHDFPLVESSFNSWYGECCLFSVFGCKLDLVISAGEVEG